MCVNYRPAGRNSIEEYFRVKVDSDTTWRDEAWKDYQAPIIRRNDAGERAFALASYGIVPRRHIPEGVKVFDTMNARAETVAEKRSFSPAWKKTQLCLVPMLSFFEPNYESGKPVRWEISMADETPFAVAGLWREWSEPDGTKSLSFSQLTVNADEHPLMRRFHKPGDEKRALIVVPFAEYDDWLTCKNPEVARSFLRVYPSEQMTARPMPIPPRKS